MDRHRNGTEKAALSLGRLGGLRRADGGLLLAFDDCIPVRSLPMVGHDGSCDSGAGGTADGVPNQNRELARSGGHWRTASSEPGTAQICPTRFWNTGK